jgi:2-keto-3-deoxy-L-rhamnonate aldolase RhmA
LARASDPVTLWSRSVAWIGIHDAREEKMRLLVVLSLATAVLVAAPASLAPQKIDRMNPIIAAQEKGSLAVLGIAHPAIVRGGRGRASAAVDPAAPPPPPIVLADVAKETVDYKRADYLYTSGTSDTFLSYIEEIKKAGGSMRTHPFTAKIGIWNRNPENVNAAIVRQLNAGHVGVSMEAVESAQEVRDVIKAMRLTSAGGTRPETGLEKAAAYWGLSVEAYKKKADIWPLNKNGELLISVIIESRPGLENAREIAAEPGVGQIFAGYGTLGGVFRDDPAGREAAAAKILAACKEFKVPCGFPTNNPAEIEQRMKEGWSVFIMQRRDENAFAAVETARKLSGR